MENGGSFLENERGASLAPFGSAVVLRILECCASDKRALPKCTDIYKGKRDVDRICREPQTEARMGPAKHLFHSQEAPSILHCFWRMDRYLRKLFTALFRLLLKVHMLIWVKVDIASLI